MRSALLSASLTGVAFASCARPVTNAESPEAAESGQRPSFLVVLVDDLGSMPTAHGLIVASHSLDELNLDDRAVVVVRRY